MPAKALPTDLPICPFPSKTAFETFLHNEHHTSPGIHLKLAKKSSGIPSISASDAVEAALCYGWIDGQANSVDEQWWLVRFTPRRAKSIWSKKNVDTVARLMEEGRMRDLGIAAVDAAKADGRWERAYAGPATIQVAEDFQCALDKDPAAAAVFAALNKSQRYSVLWRVDTAAPRTRAKRIAGMVQTLAAGEVPGATPAVVSRSYETKPKSKATKVPHTTKSSASNKVVKRSGLRSRGGKTSSSKDT